MRLRLLTALCGLTILAAVPAPAQTLHIALREDPDILDPTLARSYVGRIAFAGLCDKLFDIDEKLQIVPQLALGYEWADPKTLVIHLRPNVTFQDGEKFDAAAVKYGLERHLTMQGSFRRAEIGVIDHIEVVDPLTVRLVLKSPSSPLLSLLTDRAGMIVAPKAAEAEGSDFGLHPVCNGPFKFAERVAQDRIVLDRYPGYWDAKDIHFDRVIYQPMPGQLGAGRQSARRQHRHRGTGAAHRCRRGEEGPQTSHRRPPRRCGTTGLTFNLGNGEQSKSPIGQSALLRQAFEAAIDRQALNQVVFNGMYQPTVQAIPPSSPFYVPGFEAPPRDLAKAIALVKQSGMPTPITVTMNVPNTSDNAQMAEVMQSMVRDAGFDLKINLIEFASSLAAAARGDFQSYLIGWSGRVDPDGNLYVFLHSGAGQNDGRYSNPIVDAALDTARTLTDTAARRAEYTKMLVQERKDLPIIYLLHPVNIVGISAKLTGFRPMPDGIIRLQGLSVTQ